MDVELLYKDRILLKKKKRVNSYLSLWRIKWFPPAKPWWTVDDYLTFLVVQILFLKLRYCWCMQEQIAVARRCLLVILLVVGVIFFVCYSYKGLVALSQWMDARDAARPRRRMPGSYWSVQTSSSLLPVASEYYSSWWALILGSCGHCNRQSTTSWSWFFF